MKIQSETFCPCIGFISDKYRVSQELLKMENATLLISSSNYAKRHINVCSGARFVFPVFPEVGDSIFLNVPGLYFYLREQPFSHTESRVSAYE